MPQAKPHLSPELGQRKAQGAVVCLKTRTRACRGRVVPTSAHPSCPHSQAGLQPRTRHKPGHPLPSSPRGRWPRPKPNHRRCLEEPGKIWGQDTTRTAQPSQKPCGPAQQPPPSSHILGALPGQSGTPARAATWSPPQPGSKCSQPSAAADPAQGILVASEGSSTWQAGTRCAQGAPHVTAGGGGSDAKGPSLKGTRTLPVYREAQRVNG